MAFTALNDEQVMALEVVDTAVATGRRAEQLRHLAETRLALLERAEPLLDGDPWMLDQSRLVQTAYRSHFAESSALEYRRLADALFWTGRTRALIDTNLPAVTGEGQDD